MESNNIDNNTKNDFKIKEIKIDDALGPGTLIISKKYFDKFVFDKSIETNHSFRIGEANRAPIKKELHEIIFINTDKNRIDLRNKIKINISNSINKIKINSEFFCCSSLRKFSIIKDNNGLDKCEKSLEKCFENKYVRQIIVLDNKNIVANISPNLISFYPYKISKYEKFFNNLNKYYDVLDLCKLSNNSFCFVSIADKYDYSSGLALSMFNEDFYSKEIFLKKLKPNNNLCNHILFRINDDNLVIIGLSSFIIFNIKNFEITTIVETDEILCSLKFTKGDPNLQIYEYFALIIKKNKTFYLKIYRFFDEILEESPEFNLKEYSSVIKHLFDIFKIKKEIKENIPKNDIDINMESDSDSDIEINILHESDNDNDKDSEILFKPFKLYKINNNDDVIGIEEDENMILNLYEAKEKESTFKNHKNFKNVKEVSFDMNYDIKSNGNVILIIGINYFSEDSKRLFSLLEINLDKIEFH